MTARTGIGNDQIIVVRSDEDERQPLLANGHVNAQRKKRPQVGHGSNSSRSSFGSVEVDVRSVLGDTGAGDDDGEHEDPDPDSEAAAQKVHKVRMSRIVCFPN